MTVKRRKETFLNRLGAKCVQTKNEDKINKTVTLNKLN